MFDICLTTIYFKNMAPEDYHKKPTITFRLDTPEEKERLEEYAKKHSVSVGWILKRAIKLFWEAVHKGEIKP